MSFIIIGCDPMDREGPGYDDKLVCHMEDREVADQVVTLLNNDPVRVKAEDYYFQVKPRDYKLKRFEP